MKPKKSDCVATAVAAVKLLKTGLAKSDLKEKSRCLIEAEDLIQADEFQWEGVPDGLVDEFVELFDKLYEEVADGVSES